jgi:hypothetical protein
MPRDWVRRPGTAAKIVVGLIVMSMVSMSAPAFAAESLPDPAAVGKTETTLSGPIAPLEQAASRYVQSAFEQSLAREGRRLAFEAAQTGGSDTSSGHWCLIGLVLAAAGVTAAIVSGVQRDYNAQKPSPPVGVVLGVAAAASGGVMMIRTCKK